MLSALIAAISGATKVILSKKILSIDSVPFIPFLGVETTFAFYLMLPLLILFGDVDLESIAGSHYLAFFLIVIIAFFYNYLYFYGLKNGRLCDVQPISMTAPFFVIVLSTFFYPDERNFFIFIPAIIASTAIMISRIEKKHLVISRPVLSMLGFAILFALESLLAKHVLEVVNSVAFYSFRIGILSFLFLFFFRPNLNKFKEKISIKTFIVSIFLIAELVFYYMAINRIGLVATSLVYLLAPVIIIAGSAIIFKEKITLKSAVADVIVLCCVAIAFII